MSIGIGAMEKSIGGASKKKLRMELSHDPGIPLLGVYPEEIKTGSQRDICTPMFIAASLIKPRYENKLNTQQ